LDEGSHRDAFGRRVLHLPVDPTASAIDGPAVLVAQGSSDERPGNAGRFHASAESAARRRSRPLSLELVLSGFDDRSGLTLFAIHLYVWHATVWCSRSIPDLRWGRDRTVRAFDIQPGRVRSEEHTSELQSQ